MELRLTRLMREFHWARIDEVFSRAIAMSLPAAV